MWLHVALAGTSHAQHRPSRPDIAPRLLPCCSLPGSSQRPCRAPIPCLLGTIASCSPRRAAGPWRYADTRENCGNLVTGLEFAKEFRGYSFCLPPSTWRRRICGAVLDRQRLPSPWTPAMYWLAGAFTACVMLGRSCDAVLDLHPADQPAFWTRIQLLTAGGLRGWSACRLLSGCA
jgi:hypothetical protein